MSVNWDSVRKQFELPEGTVYLNNGSFGPSPKPVLDAAAKYLRDIDSNPGAMLSVYWKKVQDSKKHLGSYTGMKPDDFVYVTNVTAGMNMASRGLRCLEEGDEILSTDQEYGAVDNTWGFLAKQKKLSVKKVSIPSPPDSAAQIIELITREIGSRTKVLYFSHITTSTGLILPVKEICRAARERGVITVIDGAHAPGMIPLNIEALGCDIYTGNCHKWLCGPKGTGFLWAAPDFQDNLDPFIVGWGWKRGEETFIGNFENPGTHCTALPAAVMDAVKFQEEIGKGEIARYGRELAAYGRGVMTGIDGCRPLTPSDGDLSCSLAAYLLPDIPEGRLREELSHRGIIIPNARRDDGTWIRVSTHIYNTPHEVDLLGEAVKTAL